MTAAGVTVGKLLQCRPEAPGLDLELLAGAGGLDRRILRPYAQKTGLAFAGFQDDNFVVPAEKLEHRLTLAGRDELDESETEERPDTGEEP